MDTVVFDLLTRHVAALSARRPLLRGIAALALSGGSISVPHLASAKKHKKKKPRPKLNEFGCVNVGGKCRGKNALCCSGICQGKKPKKGQKDKSRCVAHDEGIGCAPGLQVGFCGGTTVTCTTSLGGSGLCDTTTGNAAYCTGDGECYPCQKDQDCVPLCGERAACVKCETGCASSGGTVCVGAAPGSCTVF